MKKLNLIATTTFGLEAIAKRELIDLGYEIKEVKDGRIKFEGTIEDVARTNISLRTADRILIEIATFPALTFEELFDRVYEVDWGEIIPKKANFIVDGKSVKSKLFSVSDCQRITEKAIIEKLKTKYKINWFEKSGALYKFEIGLLKDIATLTLDTTGPGLHKRGYRKLHGEAPIKETLAAAMVLLSFWNKDRVLYDPFCGTGTILIEAAMIGKNIAPGIDRGFSFTNWTGVDKNILKEERIRALNKIDNENNLQIFGTDIDKSVLEIAKSNIESLNLEDDIKVYNMDFRNFVLNDNYGVLITNPPYGKRLNEENFLALEKELGRKMKDLKTWSNYIITSDEDFERNFSKRADRKRKLYNGRIKVDYYQYFGPKPER